MRVNVYGQKAFEERVKKYIKKRIKSKQIARVDVYLYNVDKECFGCIYFPCEEKCRKIKKLYRTKKL